MRILFEITHPAHVHLFRYPINILQSTGANIKVTSREKGVTTSLLDSYGINHRTLSSASSTYSLTSEWITRVSRLLSTVYSFNPDVIVGRFNPAAAVASTMAGCPYIMFEDTEKSHKMIFSLTYRMSNIIHTPEGFNQNLGPKQTSYPGFHELAYLHPNRFDPDSSILEQHDIKPGDRFSLIRFVGWEAHHDKNESGFSQKDRLRLVSLLSEYGEVYITSEGELPDDLAKYQLPIPPEHIHHLLYYSDIFVGDSQTMACEAGILGTPAIRYNSLAGGTSQHGGIQDELEREYGLIYSTDNIGESFAKIKEIIGNSRKEEIWQIRRKNLINDKIDVTHYITNSIRNVVV
mgnify:CR=1 FL=1